MDGALYIASRRIDSGPRVAVVDPWSGEPVAEVVLAGDAQVEEAMGACVPAFERMRARTSYERKSLLFRVARAIEGSQEVFAHLISRESGKPIALSRAEVARAVCTFDLGAEEAGRMAGEVMPLDTTAGSRGYVSAWARVPAGPVIAISPFNFPLNLVAHKVVPALACGCSVVLKPAPQSPLTSLLLAEHIRAAGAPDDAVQVVPCEVAAAEKMVKDDRFATLSFTGSVAGAFGYAGQTCIKVQRLYVHAPIADDFIERIVSKTKAVEPKPPLEVGTLCGPMIDERSARRVQTWVEEATQAGARIRCGARREGNRYWP